MLRSYFLAISVQRLKNNGSLWMCREQCSRDIPNDQETNHHGQIHSQRTSNVLACKRATEVEKFQMKVAEYRDKL
jgi:hypothetical protein